MFWALWHQWQVVTLRQVTAGWWYPYSEVLSSTGRDKLVCRWCLPCGSTLYWWGPIVPNSLAVRNWYIALQCWHFLPGALLLPAGMPLSSALCIAQHLGVLSTLWHWQVVTDRWQMQVVGGTRIHRSGATRADNNINLFKLSKMPAFSNLHHTVAYEA